MLIQNYMVSLIAYNQTNSISIVNKDIITAMIISSIVKLPLTTILLRQIHLFFRNFYTKIVHLLIYV